MSTSFFIGPFDPKLWKDGSPDPEPTSTLRIDPADYQQALFERWPTARGWTPELTFSSTGMVSWNLDGHYLYGVEVHLHKDLQYVSFSSRGINFLEFILWHRMYIPAEHTLYLFNSSSCESLVLTPAISRETVIEFTGYYDQGLKKNSPLNGTWDGFVIGFENERITNLTSTLHLFDHGDELRGEMLITKWSKDIAVGALYIQLRGHTTTNRDEIELHYMKTLNVIGEGIAPPIAGLRILRLQFEDSTPPRLHGTCDESDQKTLGEAQFTRRGLYDPPPP